MPVISAEATTEEIQAALQITPEMTAETPETPAAEPMKRKRGRPRKNASTDGSASSGSTNRKSVTSEIKLIREALQAQFAGLAIMVTYVEPFDGSILAERGPAFIDQLVTVAEHNPAFREMLIQFTRGSAYASLIASLLALITPILAHHGIVPEMFIFGISDEALAIHTAMKEKEASRRANKQNGGAVINGAFR